MRIACWQAPTRVDDEADVLALLHARADEAARAGARLLVTPELSMTGYVLDPSRLRELAEPEGGGLCAEVARIAAQCGIAIVWGWPESDGDTVHNSVGLVDAGGHHLATYRKTHLFGDGERACFGAGTTGLVHAEVDGITVGLVVCYDVEFPELVRRHALRGTELLVVPTALMSPWQFVAETLVPARAFESQLFVAYTNWTGAQGDQECCGLTRVVGPDGRIAGSVAPGAGEELLVVELNLSLIARARAATTYLDDRRPELYEL